MFNIIFFAVRYCAKIDASESRFFYSRNISSDVAYRKSSRVQGQNNKPAEIPSKSLVPFGINVFLSKAWYDGRAVQFALSRIYRSLLSRAGETDVSATSN